MALQYLYRARNKENQVITGKVQAATVEAARKILLKHQLTPISISQPKTWMDYVPFQHSVSMKQKTVFARQLSTMIEAGLTLGQALRLMVRQSEKGYFQDVLSAILANIEDGFSFSTALAQFPDVFDSIFINVIRSGEATGKLEMVLGELANTYEKKVTTTGKIKGALFYPAFIILTMFGVGAIMMTKVIPQLKDVFDSSGKALPESTQILIAISDFLVKDWFIAIAGIIILVVALRLFFRSETGIELVSKIGLKLPIAKAIVMQNSMAQMARLLSMLLGSGVPLLEALRLIQESFTNRVYKRALTKISAEVEKGIPMSVPIGANPVFPLLVGQMVAVGEQTGKMDEVMLHMALYYEAEVDVQVNGLSSLIEPVIMVLLGVAVAWLVIAILLPIYQISSTT